MVAVVVGNRYPILSVAQDNLLGEGQQPDLHASTGYSRYQTHDPVPNFVDADQDEDKNDVCEEDLPENGHEMIPYKECANLLLSWR